MLLERDGHRIAVEFSSTTGVTHETQNILKCLVANYTHIALVAADPQKLVKVAAKLREQVSEATFVRIGFYEVEPFLNHLRGLLPQPAEGPSEWTRPKTPLETKVMGWTVTTEVAEQTVEEQMEAKARTLGALADALRHPQQPRSPGD